MKKQLLALIVLGSAASLYTAGVDVGGRGIEFDPSSGSEPGSPDESLHDVDPLFKSFRRPLGRTGGDSSQSGQDSSLSSLKTSPEGGLRVGLDDSGHVEGTPHKSGRKTFW